MINISEGKLYLNAIQDLYDRSIVAYKVHSTCHMSLITEPLKSTVKSNAISPQLNSILHTDNGSHFRSLSYGNLAKQLNFTPSFSRKSQLTDNCMIENFSFV